MTQELTKDLREQLSRFSAVSLDELDQRAPLQRRVDNKYVITKRAFGEFVTTLLAAHEVLEIDEQHVFEYENVYFDTPSLACFYDHVCGRRPRYKARSRLYVTTDACFFEVNVKSSEDETSKGTIDLESSEHGALTSESWRLVRQQLRQAGIKVPPSSHRL